MVQNITNAILNFLSISLFEEFIWVLLILIFLKRFDLLDRYMWKENIKWIFLPTILTSISINIFIYIIPNIILKFIVSIIILYYSMNYILVRTDPLEEKIEWYKIVISIIFSMFIIAISEAIYVPVMFKIFNQSMDLLNKNILLKFIMNLPAKTFQLLTIYFVYKKYNDKNEKYIFNILKDKLLTLTTIIFSGLILFVLAYIVKLTFNSEVIDKYSLLTQVSISVLITVIPTILVFLYIIPINYLLSQLFRVQQNYQQMYDDVDNTDV